MATTWIILSWSYNESVHKKKQNVLVIDNFQPKSILLIISERGKKRIYFLYIRVLQQFSHF